VRFPVSLLLVCLSGAAAAQPVASGSDVIDRALVRLVPAPYTATIDAKVPAETVLTWRASSDWMRALHEATSAAGLRVQPHFEAGRVHVVPGPEQPKKTLPAVAADAAPKSTLTADGKPTGPAAVAAPIAAATPVAAVVATPVAAPSPIPAAPVAPIFLLKPGQRIDAQFIEWSKREGWSLLWTSEKSWVLPGTSSVTYAGPVDAAIESAVKDLYGNGVPVRLDIWEANKVMEISHAK